MKDLTHMRRIISLPGLVAVAALWAGFISPAEARHDHHHDDRGRGQERSQQDNRRQEESRGRQEWGGQVFQQDDRPRTSRKDAARRTQQQYGGRVLSVDPEDEGRPGYRVKSLSDDGTVRELHVD